MPMGDGVDYTVLTTAGRAVAGAMQIDPSWGPTPTRWEVYFAVEDCDATFDRALSLGGTAGSAPADSPAGRFAGINDPQGGRFSIIKNDPSFSM
jgi:predicted enzyme related to lactoylglutathione lyase